MLSALYLVGPVSDGGYGTINEAVALRAIALGIDVKLTATGLPPDPNLVPQILSQRFMPPEYIGTALEKGIPTLLHVSPHGFNGHGLLILKTTHESDILPPPWVLSCNSARAIILQTEWAKKVFIQNGVKVPIYVVPEGLDPTDDPAFLRQSPDVFRFFCLDKCVGVTIAAFQKAFGNDPSVELIVKARAPMNRPGEFTNLPANIKMLDFGFLSRVRLREIYYTSHCLVHPVEGAGWCLPLCEAIAKGVPVIANRHTAIADYIEPGEILEPGFEERPFIFEPWSAYPGMPLGSKYYPQVDSLADALLTMRRDHATWSTKTLSARSRLLKTLTWDKTTEALLATLDAIQ